MNLRGVKFGEYHTATDWELILNSKSIDPPKPKTVTKSIDGRDGVLDLSEALTGEIKYENRTATFGFLITEGSYLDREDTISEILSVIHGKRLAIILDDDTTRYFYGRCKVKSRENNKAYGSIEIECDCDPWRYSVNETIRTFTAGASTEITLTNNGYKTLTPEITVSGEITLVFGTTSVTLSSGTYKLTGLTLKHGTTLVSLAGSGTISFKYREGVL